MLNVGEKVKIISVDGNVNPAFYGRIGIIDKIKEKEHYCYHLIFIDPMTNREGEYFWWSEKNVEPTEESVDNCESIDPDKLAELVLAKKGFFPNISQSVFLLLGWFATQILLALFLVRFIPISRSRSLVYTVVVVIMIFTDLSIALIGCKLCGKSIKQLFKNPRIKKQQIASLLILLIGFQYTMLSILSFLESTFPIFNNSLDQLTKTMGGMNSGILGLLYICLIAPFLEEVIFRGIILRGLLKNYKAPVAIIVSALFFGVAHGNLLQGFSAFCFGIILALTYFKTYSLKICFALHAINNTIACTTIPILKAHLLVSFIIGVIILAVTITQLLRSPSRCEDIIDNDSSKPSKVQNI